MAIVDVLRDVAEAHEASVARIALAWLLHRPAVTSVILGARRPEQLRDTLQASAVRLTPAELARLDDVSAIPIEYPQWMAEHPWDERIFAPPVPRQAVGRDPATAPER